MTATEVFTNDGQGIVTLGGITAPASGTVETWTVSVQVPFPAATSGVTQFHVADPASGMETEKILVTSGSGALGTQTWTVTRGDEGTTPLSHASGFTIRNVVTAAWFNNPPTGGGGGSGTVMPWNLLGGWAGSSYDPALAILSTNLGQPLNTPAAGFIFGSALAVDTAAAFNTVLMLGANPQTGTGAIAVLTDSAGDWVAHVTNADAAFQGIAFSPQYVSLTLNTTVTPSAPGQVYYLMYLFPVATVSVSPSFFVHAASANWYQSQGEVAHPSALESVSGTNTSIPNPVAPSSLGNGAFVVPWFAVK